MPELIGRRTYSAKTHYDAGVFILEAHVGHVHYKDDVGDFQDVDLRFVDQGTYWELTQASYWMRVAKSFGASQLIQFQNCYEEANHTILYEPHSLWWVNTQDTSQRTKLADAQVVTGALVDDHTIRWSDAFGLGVHFEVILQRSGFRKEIVFDSQPTGSPYANYALIVATRWTGSGLAVKAEGGSDWDGSSYYESGERFEIREAGGQRSYIRRAYARDAANRTRSLRVFFERRAGALWQGKLLTQQIIENATYPLRADATTSYYSGAGDGYVQDGGIQTWDATHDAATGDVASAGAATGLARSFRNTSTGYCEILRGFLPIDTSGLPDAAVISAAIFYVYVATVYDTDDDGDDWITVVQTNQASPTTLITADFDQCGDNVDNPTEGIDPGDRADCSSISTVAYTAFPLNATGRGWISKVGYTLPGLREGHDCIDDPIVGTPGNDGIEFYTSERTGTSEDPYLSVTYTLPVPSLDEGMLVGGMQPLSAGIG